MTTDPQTEGGGATVLPVAVVTGAASGIGLAFAESYARAGFRVVMVDLNRGSLEAAADELAAEGLNVVVHELDLREPDHVETMAEIAHGLGPITAICLNAGVTTTGQTVWETDPSTMASIIDVNLAGLHHSIRALVPRVLMHGDPAEVVVTASMAGLVASGWSGAYAASKAGAVALTKALHQELGSLAPHVKVALLCPGMVRTNLMRTSVASLPRHAAMSEDFVAMGHDALNTAGVEPTEVVGWTRRALAEGRFWVVPPLDDMFGGLLDAELNDQGAALRLAPDSASAATTS